MISKLTKSKELLRCWKSPVLKALSFLSSNYILWEMHSIYCSHYSVADLFHLTSRAFGVLIKHPDLDLRPQPKLVDFNTSPGVSHPFHLSTFQLRKGNEMSKGFQGAVSW